MSNTNPARAGRLALNANKSPNCNNYFYPGIDSPLGRARRLLPHDVGMAKEAGRQLRIREKEMRTTITSDVERLSTETVRDFFATWHRSKPFLALRSSTQGIYLARSADLCERMGDGEVFSTFKSDAFLAFVRDDFTASMARMIKAMVGSSISWARSDRPSHYVSLDTTLRFLRLPGVGVRNAFIPDADIHRIIAAADASGHFVMGTLILTLYKTGQRFGDIAQRRRVELIRSDSGVAHLPFLTEKTGASVNPRLPRSVMVRIDTPCAGSDSPWLFPKDKNITCHLDYPAVAYRWRIWLRELGLPSSYCLHDLRRSFVVFLLSKGDRQIEEIALYAGWTGNGLRAFYKHYLSLTPDMNDRVSASVQAGDDV